MHDAVIVTLCILTAALLRRSLLTAPDASHGVRAGGRENGFETLVPVKVEAKRPLLARRIGPKREGHKHIDTIPS